MKKINLLIITDTYIGLPGGSERHLLNFVKFLDYEKFNVVALQLFPQELDVNNQNVLNDIAGLAVLHEPLESIKSLVFIRLFFKIKRLVKKFNINLVVSYHEKSDLLNYLLSLSSGSSIKHISSKRDLGFKLQGILKFIMKFITPKFKVITTPSESIKKMLSLEYKVNEDKINVIPNGVDLSTYKKSTIEEKIKFKKNLEISSDCYVAVCVGSLKEVKGHDFLISSFHQFCSGSTHEWHLVIIGVGELESYLKKLCSTLGVVNVHFKGLQTNVEYWLSNADLIVSSSSSEGLSNALIEGIACGLPVIATNVGGNPELVQTGENGILVEFNEEQQLSEAFDFFDKNLEYLISYGQKSRLLAESKFANEIMVDRIQNLYSKQIAGFNSD